MIFRKTEKQLKAMKKEDIIKDIISAKWHMESFERTNESLTKDLALLNRPYDQAKLLVCGFIGKEIPPKSEYDDNPDLSKVDLCGVIGELIAISSGVRK